MYPGKSGDTPEFHWLPKTIRYKTMVAGERIRGNTTEADLIIIDECKSYEPDMVNAPPHYKSESGLEVLDVIKAFKLDFRGGNIIKYFLRAGKKGGRVKGIEDLKKARFYLDDIIKEWEQDEVKQK